MKRTKCTVTSVKVSPFITTAGRPFTFLGAACISRELPLLHNAQVQASRGIRIHRGNTFEDSQGCILVGMGRDVNKCSITESALAETMVTALCRNESTLVVCE